MHGREGPPEARSEERDPLGSVGICDTAPMPTFDALIAEAESAPVEGWDFSFLDGRATEQRPSWGYAKLLAARMAESRAALDVQTGGGEVLAGIPAAPPRLVATESWFANLSVARAALVRLGAGVVAADNDCLPFRSASFDLVVSRHPVTTPWDEIARVLAPGGGFLSQQVGAGSNRELTDFMMGPQPLSEARSVARHRASARKAGLELTVAGDEWLRVVFLDVGAVAYFLRKVPWTVPDFSVWRYRHRLWAMHEQIEREGEFRAHSHRFLIEACRPVPN